MLPGEVFAGNQSLNDVAAQWVQRFEENETEELAALVNFVLRCAGCDLKIEAHNIEDPDSVTSKLGDIQDEYQAVSTLEAQRLPDTDVHTARYSGVSLDPEGQGVGKLSP